MKVNSIWAGCQTGCHHLNNQLWIENCLTFSIEVIEQNSFPVARSANQLQINVIIENCAKNFYFFYQILISHPFALCNDDQNVQWRSKIKHTIHSKGIDHFENWHGIEWHWWWQLKYEMAHQYATAAAVEWKRTVSLNDTDWLMKFQYFEFSDIFIHQSCPRSAITCLFALIKTSIH